MSALTFLLVCLGAFRATRFITDDTILDGPRHRWFLRFPPDEKYASFRLELGEDGWAWVPSDVPRRIHPLGQLVDCPWCVGWWAAGAAVTVAALTGVLPCRPSTWWLVWPAAAAVVGLVAKNLDA